jgi:hypothetical protein
LQLARALIEGRAFSIAFVRDGKTLATGERSGVADLLAIAEKHGRDLAGAAVADRVVGRAAALVFLFLGVYSVYAQRISDAGLAALEAGSIPVEYGEQVPAILNRAQDGPCPFETRAATIRDPSLAPQALAEVLQSMRPAPP